jgi:hypothetical protein
VATTANARTSAPKRRASGSVPTPQQDDSEPQQDDSEPQQDDSEPQQDDSGSGRSTAVRTVARAAAGAAVAGVGLAAAAAVKRSRRPRVLGIPVPRELSPRTFDVKKMAKRVEDVADRLERVSDDVRLASAQAKRAAKKVT